jgi:hypothetical protein
MQTKGIAATVVWIRHALFLCAFCYDAFEHLRDSWLKPARYFLRCARHGIWHHAGSQTEKRVVPIIPSKKSALLAQKVQNAI